MKYYVVADVHGFYDELIQALAENGFFAETNPHKLVICGDLFDRGSQATQLQSFIVDLIKQDRVVLVRGNHEDLIEELVGNIYRWFNSYVTDTHHWRNGTVDTILQLTNMDLSQALYNVRECFTRVINSDLFSVILPKMQNYFETENYVFVHGYLPCEQFDDGENYGMKIVDNYAKADEQSWKDARWYNGMHFANSGLILPNKKIVCGHYHCSYGHAVIENKGTEYGENADFSPYYGKGIIAIDAYTVYSKKVNCIVIED